MSLSVAVRTMIVVGVAMLTFDDVVAQETEGPRVESNIGVDATNQYFFRGLLQENKGAIVQPWIDIVFPIGGGDNTSWTFNLGSWNSLHDGPTGSGGDGMTIHYEMDLYAGIGVDFAQNWSVAASYVALTSPNSAFTTVQELDFLIAFDDASLFGGESGGFSGVQPSVMVAWELKGQADGGRGGGDEGIYLELGLEPAFELFSNSNQPVSTTFPLIGGFSLKDYYEDELGGDHSFGFAQVGITLSTPLNFIPVRLGSWTASGAASALYLGDTLKAINGEDSSEAIFSLGLDIAY